MALFSKFSCQLEKKGEGKENMIRNPFKVE